jgi:hypothetical protein
VLQFGQLELTSAGGKLMLSMLATVTTSSATCWWNSGRDRARQSGSADAGQAA